MGKMPGMEYLLVPLAALLASGLTLFSGFGLGTLLLPAFALFFPVDAAVALTAVVHFLNNLFKLALLGRAADRATVLRFGLPAVLCALLGAALLVHLQELRPLLEYGLGGRRLQVTPVKLCVAALMASFALLEIAPRFGSLAFHPRWQPLGGALSGFLGGLSGHQGALRSAFLLRAGLSKEAFVATGVVTACLVDASRLSLYAAHFAADGLGANAGLLALACLAAFAGAFLGRRLLRKVTLRAVQVLVAGLLLLLSLALGAGLV